MKYSSSQKTFKTGYVESNNSTKEFFALVKDEQALHLHNEKLREWIKKDKSFLEKKNLKRVEQITREKS